MAVIIGSARSDERGKITGGKDGDQLGTGGSGQQNIFKIAGPVIAYGVIASVIAGIIFLFILMCL